MSVRLRATKRAQTLVGSVPNQSLEAAANCVRVGVGVAGSPRLPE